METPRQPPRVATLKGSAASEESPKAVWELARFTHKSVRTSRPNSAPGHRDAGMARIVTARQHACLRQIYEIYADRVMAFERPSGTVLTLRFRGWQAFARDRAPLPALLVTT